MITKSSSNLTHVPPGNTANAGTQQTLPELPTPLNRVQFQATVVYTLFGVLPLIGQFFLFPINTRFLEPADFGVATLANVCRSYVAVLLLFGFDAAVTRSYFDCSNQAAEVRRLVGTAFTC